MQNNKYIYNIYMILEIYDGLIKHITLESLAAHFAVMCDPLKSLETKIDTSKDIHYSFLTFRKNKEEKIVIGNIIGFCKYTFENKVYEDKQFKSVSLNTICILPKYRRKGLNKILALHVLINSLKFGCIMVSAIDASNVNAKHIKSMGMYLIKYEDDNEYKKVLEFLRTDIVYSNFLIDSISFLRRKFEYLLVDGKTSKTIDDIYGKGEQRYLNKLSTFEKSLDNSKTLLEMHISGNSNYQKNRIPLILKSIYENIEQSEPPKIEQSESPKKEQSESPEKEQFEPPKKRVRRDRDDHTTTTYSAVGTSDGKQNAGCSKYYTSRCALDLYLQSKSDYFNIKI